MKTTRPRPAGANSKPATRSVSDLWALYLTLRSAVFSFASIRSLPRTATATATVPFPNPTPKPLSLIRLPFPTPPPPSRPPASSPRPRRRELELRRPARLSASAPPYIAAEVPREKLEGFVTTAASRARRLRLVITSAADLRDMLPGPIVPPPPPPPLAIIGSAFVPSPLLSDPHSSSISSSLAIIIVIIITTVTITTCIVILRRGCHRRHRLSYSSLSPRRSFSPMASVSSSSAESGMRSAASAAVGVSPRDRAAMTMVSLAPKDSGTASAASSVTDSAEGPVKGAELVSSSPVSAVMTTCGVDKLVPSAPSLPAEERLILELLSLPEVRIKPGQRMVCIICKHEFLPTDILLVLPVCSHVFHQACIVKCLRCTTPSCCPSCYASITIPIPDKTKVAPTFCSDEYDIESQVRMPSTPGEEVAGAVGESHGWLRSSLDRLSGSWRGCSSNSATAVVVPLSSQHTTGSPSEGLSDRLGNGLDCVMAQKPLSIPAPEKVPEAVRGSPGWLRSLASLSGSWSGHSSSCSTEVRLPVTSRHVTETLTSSGHSITDSWSRSGWDLEAGTATTERPSFYEYARSFFRSSG